jgi:hypothetical protein
MSIYTNLITQNDSSGQRIGTKEKHHLGSLGILLNYILLS